MNSKLLGIVFVAALTAGIGFYFFQQRSSNKIREAGTAPVSAPQPPGISSHQEISKTEKGAPFCPVPKPELIPPALEQAFQPAPKPGESEQNVSPRQQIAEITALATKPRDEQSARALRWLIHQADRSAPLRNEGLVTLAAWNTEWLAGDMVKMLHDEAQSPLWRSYCVQHLGEHFKKHQDQASLDAVHEAARVDDREGTQAGRDLNIANDERATKANSDAQIIIRNQAVYSLALLAKDLQWQSNDAERFKTFVMQVNDALSARQPGTVVSALRAIAAAGLKDKAVDAERLASDPRQALEIRVAAVQALGAVGRAESIPILEACAKSTTSSLVRLAQVALNNLRGEKTKN